ncbi:MAG: tRNA(Ile)-lysidine synthase [Acidimicrobiales bacterium]
MPEALHHPHVGELLGRCQFPPADTAVVCAVSGGADSLALLALASAAGLDTTAVHVDHGLRSGSAAEALVVERAAARFGAHFRAERVNIEQGSDLEARAREARQTVLGPHALTGHTADDQAETVLINLLRGSGVSGLGAMRPGGRHPILHLRRHETLGLCAMLRLDPVADPSNDDPRFVRNRIRAEVLPLLADISGRDPVPRLVQASAHARDADQLLTLLAGDLDPTDTSALQAAPRGLAAVALRRWLTDAKGHPPTTADLERVMTVVDHVRVACELSGGRRIARTGGVLRIECADR